MRSLDISCPSLLRIVLLTLLCALFILPLFIKDNSVTAQTGPGKSAPTVSNEITGTVSYCASSTPKFVGGAAMTAVGGTPTGNANTNTSGVYDMMNMGVGFYAVSGTKTTQINGITPNDASQVAQHIAQLITLSTCKQISGNVDESVDGSGNPTLTPQDASFIAQFIALLPNASNHTGQWRFKPTSGGTSGGNGNCNFPSDASPCTVNFNGHLLGDVDGDWNPAGPNQITSPRSPNTVTVTSVPVSLPNPQFAHPSTTISVPVRVGQLPAAADANAINSFALCVVFDSTRLQLPATASQCISRPGTLTDANLTASWSFSINRTQANRIIVVAFGDGSDPVVNSGGALPDVLLNLRFNVIGTTGQSTALTFTDPGTIPNGFTFNAGDPTASLTNGQITIGPTTVHFGDCQITAYDGGSVLEWQTGHETSNLGFNIYREEGGKRIRVNSNLIAGSALKSQADLGAGEAYAWWDENPDTGASYWIEDIDLNGKSSLHGPFYAKFVGGNPPERSRAALLSNLGNRAKEDNTKVVEDRSFTVNDKNTFKASERYALVAGAKNSFASDPSVKISIKDAGWYRVTQPELVAAGLNPNANPATLQLYVDGREIPMSVSSHGGNFDSQSDIEFYATALNTQASDTHVYWLVAGNQSGLRILSSKNDGAQTATHNFTQTVERKDRTLYFSSLLNGDTENFFGAVISPTPVDQTITLPHLIQTEATMEVALQGVSRTTHRVSAMVNGLVVGEVNFDAQSRGTGSFTIPGSFLRDGSNTVTLLSQNGQQDVSVVDYVRVSYTHSLTADNDYLSFTANGRERVTIDGFLNRDIRVFDVTDLNAVKELTGFVNNTRNRWSVSFTSADAGVRNLVVTTQGQSKHAVSITANQPSNWRATNSAADLVIIAKGDLIPAIEPLKAARQQEGYRVAVVDVEDVYDEFNFGNKSPQAIKDFLAYARSNWSVAPRFVLFVGDATFDPKNYLGFGDYDSVPTKLVDTAVLETASDDWFADFNNDGIADMPIGRLPVRNVTELNAVVSKLTRARINTGSTSALLVSDLPDSYDFEQQSTLLRPSLSTYQVSEIKRRELGDDQARTQLLAALNSGPRIVNYYGHGSINLLRGNLLNTTDAATLTNNDSLSFFTLMDCLNGYFHDVTGDSLAEALLKANNGGALAVWTSSGLTFPDEQSRMNQQLYSQLFGALRGKITLGEAIQRAKAATTDSDIRRTWTLLGDPTTRIK